MANRVINQVAPDFSVENHGTIFLLHQLTPEAREWVFQNLPDDHQEFAGAVVVEPRYIQDIVFGISNDGLRVRS